jgi:hypothetical protein
MFELPGWAWVGVGWLLASICFGLAVGRWFRFLREPEDE